MPNDGMDIAMMLTRAGEVDRRVGISAIPRSALDLEPSGASVSDIQHSDLVKVGPTPMHTVCHCEVWGPP